MLKKRRKESATLKKKQGLLKHTLPKTNSEFTPENGPRQRAPKGSRNRQPSPTNVSNNHLEGLEMIRNLRVFFVMF